MTELPRFILIGGFLGAGKTTTIARLARRFQSQGKRVGIVTNDQTTDLVDTNLLRSEGFDVGEVAGSCFCCNFNALVDTVERLGAGQLPDVVIGEPVGSCTDIVATVIRPLEQIYSRPFEIAPYGVIVKPSHGAKILKHAAQGGFSPKAEYIFRKQIEEADFAIINRVDELPPAEVDELAKLLGDEFPGRTIIRMSAKTGEGFDVLCEFLDQRGQFGQRLMEVDYDVYAEGEAELGWLNSQVIVETAAAFDLDAFLVGFLQRLQQDLKAVAGETAHVKVIGLWEGFFGVANLVSSFTPPTLSLPSNCQAKRAEIVVNARVAIDPEMLTSCVRRALDEQAQTIHAMLDVKTLQSFRPGRPVPTHRITAPA